MSFFKRSYPFVVAGLPDLLFEAEYKNFNLESLRDQIRELIDLEDVETLKDLYYGYDNMNLVNILLKRPLSFIPRGVFTLEQLQAEIIEPKRMPTYMRLFTNAFLGHCDDEIIDKNEATQRLAEGFYAHTAKSKSAFIRKWFDFDRSFRNIEVAYLARKKNESIEKYLLGNAEEVELILKNTGTGDFGLRPFVEFAERLFQIIETPDILERERKLDVLRWEVADDLIQGENFSIDVIAAYFVKANIVDRWSRLDEEKGLEILKSIVADLKKAPLEQF